MKNWKLVYVYTTDTDKGKYKVGKAERTAETIEEAAWIRIKEQQTAADSHRNYELIKTFDAESTNLSALNLEKSFHKILSKFKIKSEAKKTSEWFECSIEDIDSAYNKIISGVDRPWNFKPRQEQKEAIEKAIEYFKTEDVFLLNAVMRFGKTFVAYSIMKELKAKKVLVITYKPAVKEEWKDNLLKHINFNNYSFFNALELKESTEFSENFVLFSSQQDIIKSNFKNKWNLAKNIEWDLVIYDEVHEGFSSENAQSMLRDIKFKKRLDMSGTPINLVNSGYYSKEQIYNWSYVDEQKRKKLDLTNEDYKYLPEINLYNYKISKDVYENLELYEKEEYYTFNKFLKVKNSEFVYKASVNRFLDNLASPEPRKLRSPWNDSEINSMNLKHTFWHLPGVAECKALKKVMNDHHFFGEYEIIVAAGDNDGKGNDTLELVKDKIFKVDKKIGKLKDKKGTITLSCGKLTTGVSIPEWGSVFFLSDIRSVQLYWQTAFRAKTINRNWKEKALIFDFDPQRSLNMMYDYALESSNEKSNVEIVRELLDCMNIFSYSGAELIKNSVEELLKEIINIGADAQNSIKRFNSDWMFIKTIELENDIVDILNKVDSSKNAKIKNLDISDNNISKGKNSKSTKKTLTPKEKETVIDNILARGRAITSRIPSFLFVNPEKIERVEDLLKTIESEKFEKLIGITIEEFKILVENNFINRNKLEKALESFHIAEMQCPDCGIIEKLELKKEILGLLHPFSNNEIMTPVKLVEEIVSKLPKEVWELQKTFCDPAIKSGVFLLEIAINLMKRLKIEDENEKLKYIIDNQLFGYCLNERAKILAEGCFERELKNVEIKNLVEFKEKENMPKFDVVIGNPPYQGTGRKKIFLDFIKIGIEITNKYLLLITPKISINLLLGEEINQKKLNRKPIIEYLNIEQKIKNKHFKGVGSDFCYFLLNLQNNIKSTTKIKVDNDEFELNLKDDFYLPYESNTKEEFLIKKSILNKCCNSKNELQRKAIRIEKNIKNKKDNIYKYKIVKKILKNNIEYVYTNIIHEDTNKLKILLPTLGDNYILDEVGEIMPGTSFTVYIPAKNKEELHNLLFFIKSKLYRFISKLYTSMRSPSDYVLKIIKIPKIDITHPWTDKDLYEFFELTQEEINYIEDHV